MKYMIHLRMFYYLTTGVVTLGILLIILTHLKKDILKWVNLSFLLFFTFSAIHLFLVYANLYYRFNAGYVSDNGAFLPLAVNVSRIRTIFYMAFAHSLYKGKEKRYFDWIALPLVLLISLISSLWAIFIALVYIPAFLLWMQRRSGQTAESLHPFIKKFTIISLLTLIPFLLDLLEEMHLFYGFLFIDFFPLCLIAIGIFFTASLARKREVLSGGIKFQSEGLTNREEEIVSCILKGQTNREIADNLFISESTVKKHINNTFRKLKIKSRWELIKISEKST